MKQALEEYLAPATEAVDAPEDANGTVEFLLRRMRLLKTLRNQAVLAIRQKY